MREWVIVAQGRGGKKRKQSETNPKTVAKIKNPIKKLKNSNRKKKYKKEQGKTDQMGIENSKIGK